MGTFSMARRSAPKIPPASFPKTIPARILVPPCSDQQDSSWKLQTTILRSATLECREARDEHGADVCTRRRCKECLSPSEVPFHNLRSNRREVVCGVNYRSHSAEVDVHWIRQIKKAEISSRNRSSADNDRGQAARTAQPELDHQHSRSPPSPQWYP